MTGAMQRFEERLNVPGRAIVLNASIFMSKKTKTTRSSLPVTPKVTAPKPVASAPGKQKPSISLEFLSSSAKKVFVAGSFNQWKPDQTPSPPPEMGVG
jgi:hypothetical protein